MRSNGAIRILMYSHDTYGLGHLTRTVRIAGSLRACCDRASILILSGSPVAPFVALPDGTDLVKLPSVVKMGPELYRARDLKVGFSRIKRVRRDLIRGIAETFRPHLFLVDNVPLGMKGEILPTLRHLRDRSPKTTIVLNLRDILDAPEVLRAAWERDGVYRAIDEYYDRILIFGDPNLFDSIAAYGLPDAKSVHLGYAAPRRRAESPIRENVSETPSVLATVGGGGDGFRFLEWMLSGLREAPGTVGSGRPRLEIVTGPLMDREQRSFIGRISSEDGVVCHEFVPDLPRRMSAVDLVVAMAGYNTTCEIFSYARAALLWARTTPRVEQLIRAESLRSRRIVSMIPPEDVSPRSIARSIGAALSDGPAISSSFLPDTGGLARAAEEVQRLRPDLWPEVAAARTPLRQTTEPESFWSKEISWYWPTSSSRTGGAS